MNIYLVLLLILVIVVLANLSMFAAVRGSRGMKVNWLNSTKDSLNQPFKKENDQLHELRQQVEKLTQTDSSDQPAP